jgi:D-alanyl-D-alanine carboxypeptidase
MRRVLGTVIVGAIVLAGLSVPAAAQGVVPTGSTTTSHSISKASSYWVVVDKLRPLSPKSYAAKDLVSVPVPHVNSAPVLRKKAADAVVKMFADYTKQTGKKMQSQSAYRSYSSQVSTYAYWVRTKGKKAADLTSARPGYSEHQTGLAIDISALPSKCALNACFATTNQGKWLAKNAYKYGFILRYPKGKTAVTGYEFEPWHYRFVGKDLAAQMRTAKISTLEEFFDLPDAEDYAG